MVALFVCAILADLSFDRDCDQPSAFTNREATLTASSAPGSLDPCARVCVPDCFCCSQSVTRGPAILAPDAGPAVLMIPVRPAAGPVGVSPVPYRPPLDLG